MPRTPVAANILATVTGNTLEPEMMAQLTQHKNEIARLISCTTSMQEHITQQNELVTTVVFIQSWEILNGTFCLKGLILIFQGGLKHHPPKRVYM